MLGSLFKENMMGDILATQLCDRKTPFPVPPGKARNGSVLGLTQNPSYNRKTHQVILRQTLDTSGEKYYIKVQ